MSEAYAGPQIVGMDLHRRRSVLVRMTESGERLETVRISNDPQRLAEVMARAGESPEVVLEATYGWYWAADTLAELGAQVLMSDLFGVQGHRLLEQVALSPAARARVNSALRLITDLDFEIEVFANLVAGRLREHPGYLAIQAIPGVGPVFAAVFVAEIGDVHRFPGPAQLASWAGLTPKHHESDTTVRRGRITKQGSRLVRWAAVEAVQRLPEHTRLGGLRDRVTARRGSRNIGVVAAARELITLVFYGLRDHHIRCLPPRAV